MPYRIDPKNPTIVQVKKNGKWTTVVGGKHNTHEQAVKHLQALVINVKHKEK